MKPRSILPLLLAAGMLTPPVQAQDAPAKIREIEQKVLLAKYQKAIQALIGSAREIQSGATGIAPEILDKRVQWLTAVGDQIGGEGKIAAAQGQDMSESADALNDLAWKMITSPDVARNPAIALKLADIAIELGGENADLKPKVLDTRARALFLLGKRDEAIAGQQKAVAAATIEEEKAGLQVTLASYQRGELPDVPAPAGEPGLSIVGDLALASKDLRTSIDEVVALQRQIENAEKENSGLAGDEIDRLKEKLTKQKEELEKLTQVADPSLRPGASDGATYLMAKLRTIVIPKIDFEDASLEEAVDFLRKRSVELDATELDPARKGLNIVVRYTPVKSAPATGKEEPKPEAPHIKSLHLRNVPLAEALRYVCEATRFRYKVDDYAVTLVNPNDQEDLFNRTFHVPPDFGSSLVSIQDLLKMCGVNFPEGASATLINSKVLVVRNTPSEIDKIETLIVAVESSRTNRAASAMPVPPPTPVAPVPVNPPGR
ncbi:hypothetical protein [Luteolibacter soli]|uniref:Uncharacterized protein n=1 Tax=Luteolibacter soli TaxID=3135280 RepID=A0ABU9ANN1_9BACT